MRDFLLFKNDIGQTNFVGMGGLGNRTIKLDYHIDAGTT